MNKYRVCVLVTMADKFNWAYLDIFAPNKTLARKETRHVLAQSRAKKRWEIQQGLRKPQWRVRFTIETITLAG